MNDHLDGTPHWWQFNQFVNQSYSGTAMVYQEALMVCHTCGQWKLVPQEHYSPTGGHSTVGGEGKK